MRGVILDGEYGDEVVHLLVELEDGNLHVRRGYGTRAGVLTFVLDDVEAALAALRAEARRRPPVEVDERDLGPEPEPELGPDEGPEP